MKDALPTYPQIADHSEGVIKGLARAVLDARSQGNRAEEIERRLELGEAYREAGRAGEAVEAALVALDMAESAQQADLRVKARMLLAGCHMHLNDSVQAFTYLAEAEGIAAEAARTDLIIDVMLARGASFGRLRNGDMAHRISEEAMRTFGDHMTPQQRAKCFNNMSAGLNDMGRYRDATPLAERGLAELAPDDDIWRAFLTANLAVSLTHQDRDEEVRRLVDEVESIAIRSGRRVILAGMMEELGVSYLGIGRTAQAIDCLQRAKTLAEELHLQTMTPTVCKHLARAYEAGGDLPRAYEELREALQSVEDAMSTDVEAGIQRALLKHQVEFAKRETALLRAGKEEAELANRAKSEFVATVSHELRTPLSGVLGMTQALARTPLSPTQREYVEMIQSSGETLFQLIGNVLDLTKAEAGKLTLANDPLDLVDLLEEVVTNQAVVAQKKHIQIRTAIASDIPWVRGDAMRLRQILQNLTGNAIKFTSDGFIELRAHVLQRFPDRLRIEISVSDTGIGIPPERIEAIFDSYEQAEQDTTQRFGGTGLGLTISRRLVERMGGELMVRSALGYGSTFTFALDFEAAHPPTSPTSRLSDAMIVGNDEELRKLLTAMDVQIVEGFLTERKSNRLVIFVAMPLGTAEIGRLTRLGHRVVRVLDLLNEPVGALDHATQEVVFRPFRRKRLRELLTEHAPAPPVANTMPLAGYRILVAEDDAVSQKIAKHLLTRLGAEVHLVTDGLAAVEAWRREAFDVVMLDHYLPGLDGLQAAARIRSEETRGQRTTILSVSADRVPDAPDAGIDRFLMKPLTEEALVPAILETALGG